ncbi:MAG: hypothetical protein ABJD97_00445 [Betaproteobacteria bacterium]
MTTLMTLSAAAAVVLASGTPAAQAATRLGQCFTVDGTVKVLVGID